MNYSFLEIARRLREQRISRSLSQRDLSKLSGIPQAQISRVESGLVDLRYSSLVALASALDLEVVLVPRGAVPAVRSLTKNFHESVLGDAASRPAYTLDEDDHED